MKINKKLIKELVDNLEEFKLTEIEYSEKDTKIKVSRQANVSQNISPEIKIEKNNKKVETVSGTEIKSPIIGTFYRKPAPDKPNFVESGDTITEGDVLCVIEAMKLFNEIESEFSGKIVKILVDDASPVEFDQPLFLVDPS